MTTRHALGSWVGSVLLLAASVMAEPAALSTSPAPADRQMKPSSPARLRVYIGTYTGPKSKGIYLFDFDSTTGRLTQNGVAAEVGNPSFLAVHPSRRFLYAVGETDAFAGKKSGAVSAFSIARDSGKLTLLNQQPSGGRGPCHVTVDGSGKHVLVANYSSGSVAVLPIGTDGTLGEPTAAVQHEGSAPNRRRQEGPHAHSVTLDAPGRYAFVADLGVDKIFSYRFDPAKGALAANEPPVTSVAAGAGPRHFAFHPKGRYAYVINELNSTITGFTYDAGRGVLRDVQTLSTLPEGFSGQSTGADIHVHPSGRFLYASNRGHDSIVIFAIDSGTGQLTLVGYEPTQGKTPRNFGIDPSGTWLVAANQQSDSLVVFRIDAETGRLKASGSTAEVPSPVCVRFLSPVNTDEQTGNRGKR